jgi:CheY-like chemotaxis protein
MHTHPAPPGDDVPPIVLFVEDEADTLEMYSTFFEMSGMWVAKSRTPAEALARALELRPDLVVTDVAVAGHPEGARFVEAIKAHAETRDVPLIVLTGETSKHFPAAVLKAADLCLVKPVLPDALLMDVQRLIALSHTLRDRCQRAQRADSTAEVISPVRPVYLPADVSDVKDRPCPSCGSPLEWLERGRIGGLEYDYYRWCRQGCGLQCYDLTAGRWVKLV